MAKKSKKSTASSSLDVRSPQQIPMFENLLKRGPMAIVLVYADWCGHCQTFKNTVWNSKTLNRAKNLNTAAVHYDMLDQTSLKNTPLKGYPSLFLVGKDSKAKEIPTPQNPEELVSLDAESGTVMNNNNNTNNNNLNNNNGNTTNNNNNNNKKYYNGSPSNNTPANNAVSPIESLNRNSYTPSPPNALDDVMNTPESNETKQSGGSLFDILSNFSNGSVNVPEQKGGRRKTRKQRRRRSQTRRRV
jgi:thiol-disulfide isomerase/thioredoxin